MALAMPLGEGRLRELGRTAEGKPAETSVTRCGVGYNRNGLHVTNPTVYFLVFRRRVEEKFGLYPIFFRYNFLKVMHLHTLARVMDEVGAGGRPALTEEQKRVADAARALLPTLIEVAPKAGILPGNTPGELVAEDVNSILWAGEMMFSGYALKNELDLRGLAIKGQFGQRHGHLQSYSQDDLAKIRALYIEILTSGLGWEPDGRRRPLTENLNTTLWLEVSQDHRRLSGS